MAARPIPLCDNMLWELKNWLIFDRSQEAVDKVNLEISQVKNGDEFIACNIMREKPYTKMFDGLTGLKFARCNLVNCDLPDDSELDVFTNNAQIEYEIEEEL